MPKEIPISTNGRKRNVLVATVAVLKPHDPAQKIHFPIKIPLTNDPTQKLLYTRLT